MTQSKCLTHEKRVTLFLSHNHIIHNERASLLRRTVPWRTKSLQPTYCFMSVFDHVIQSIYTPLLQLTTSVSRTILISVSFLFILKFWTTLLWIHPFVHLSFLSDYTHSLFLSFWFNCSCCTTRFSLAIAMFFLPLIRPSENQLWWEKVWQCFLPI